jgi:molybdenum cofactor synthesis domain-containing protein
MADDTAAILIIGDEILSGKTTDENARFLIGELRALGVALRRVLVIPDVVDEIAASVRELSAGYTHVFTSGGVGPTHDDLTMEGVARAFSTTVTRHPELEHLLRTYYGERLQERDLRMADVPHGVTLHRGAQSQWPVIAMKNVFILPGVPEIFRKKFVAIREQFRNAPFHLTCVFSVDEEGKIAGHLDAVAAGFPDVAIGSYPRFVADGWKVKITLESKDSERVKKATGALVELMGSSVAKVE